MLFRSIKAPSVDRLPSLHYTSVLVPGDPHSHRDSLKRQPNERAYVPYASQTPSMQYTMYKLLFPLQPPFMLLSPTQSPYASSQPLSINVVASRLTLVALLGAPDTFPVVYTLLNPISVLFRQFCWLTSATFSGSSKIISTHCFLVSFRPSSL